MQPSRFTAQHLTSKSDMEDKENKEIGDEETSDEETSDEETSDEETSDEDTESLSDNTTSVCTSVVTLDRIVSPPQEDPMSAEVEDGQQMANDWPVYPSPGEVACDTLPFNSQTEAANIVHQRK